MPRFTCRRYSCLFILKNLTVTGIKSEWLRLNLLLSTLHYLANQKPAFASQKVTKWSTLIVCSHLTVWHALADDVKGVTLAEKILLIQLVSPELNIRDLLAACQLFTGHKDLAAVRSGGILSKILYN